MVAVTLVANAAIMVSVTLLVSVTVLACVNALVGMTVLGTTTVRAVGLSWWLMPQDRGRRGLA